MDQVFIHYDKGKFQNEYKIFYIDFSDGDNLQAVFFFKKMRLLHNEHVLFYKNNARSDQIKSL